MLSTVRSFVHGVAPPAGLTAAQTRHANALTERMEALAHGIQRDPRATLPQAEALLPELLQASETAQRQQDADLAARIALACGPYFNRRGARQALLGLCPADSGRSMEADTLFRAVLQVARVRRHEDDETRARYALGSLNLQRGASRPLVPYPAGRPHQGRALGR